MVVIINVHYDQPLNKSA